MRCPIFNIPCEDNFEIKPFYLDTMKNYFSLIKINQFKYNL